MEETAPKEAVKKVQAPEKPDAKKSSFGTFLKHCFSKKSLVKTAAVLLAAALLIGGGLYYLNSRSPKSVARRYALAFVEDDYSTICDLCAYDYKLWYTGEDEEDFLRKKSEYYGIDIASWTDYCSVYRILTKGLLEDMYGRYKLSANVTEEEDLTAEKLLVKVDVITLAIAKKCGFESDSITAGKKCTVEVKITGENDQREYIRTVYLAKIEGSWKVLEEE